MKLTGYLGGSSKQIDHGKYFNGGLELFMVHYIQRTWAMKCGNACRTHMTAGQENLGKKRCSDNLVFISADTHIQSAFDSIFRKPLLLLCLERWKTSFVKDQSKFQNPILSIYVCMRSASSSEEALCFLKEAFENAFWVVALKLHHKKYIHTRPWGMEKKLPVSLVGLMGTDSLIPRPCFTQAMFE